MWKIGKVYDPEIVGCSKIPEKDKVISNGDAFNTFIGAIIYWPHDYITTESPKEGARVFVKSISGSIAFPGIVKNGCINVFGIAFPIESGNWIYETR